MYIYQIMSNNFGYIDIILLGMIAGFIILRLRNILGRKTGHEPKIYPNFTEKKFNVPNNNVNSSKVNYEVLEGKEKKLYKVLLYCCQTSRCLCTALVSTGSDYV